MLHLLVERRKSVLGKLYPMHKNRLSIVLGLVLFCGGTARAQIISIQKVGDKTITCMHTGLTSTVKDCGVRGNWYTYVFVGLISSVAPVENGEKEIQTVPEEVFSGEPESPMRLLTSQVDCLHELKVGDRWLFFLRQTKGNPIVLDYYGNDSLPVADAQEQLATLRRLKKIGDFGFLHGQVVRGDATSPEIVPNAHVTATRRSDGHQFFSVTGPDGRFEFQPLPPGYYDIEVQPIGSYQPDDSAVNLIGGACWEVTLAWSPHARISGRVSRSDGTPLPDIGVVLIRADNSSYVTTLTNKEGLFTFGSEVSGDFVIGLDYPSRADWFNGSGAGPEVKIPPASLFYPGVQNRSSARVIRLAIDEKLDNLDFVIAKQ